MINKIKDNLAIVVTAITLMGSIGAGVQSLGAVLNTLTNIDDRMNTIEYDFQTLKESTMVSNDIADLNNPAQDSQAYELMKWEWQDLLKKITTLENNQLESWEWDNLKDRITYLEAYMHNH